MKHSRVAVATYLQTFVLIAVALGGSLLAYRAASAYAGGAGGPSIRVWDASIVQGEGVAIERLTVSDSGTSGFPYLSVLNPGAGAAVDYCYTVSSTAGAELAGTCPIMALDPRTVRVAMNLTSGATVAIVVVMEGGSVYSAGKSYTIGVSAPGASAAPLQVVAALA